MLGQSASIGPESVPGTVSLPTWVLVAAIVALFALREMERSKWFKKSQDQTDALNKLTDAVVLHMKHESDVRKGGA